MLRTWQSMRAEPFRVICAINGFKANAVYKCTALNMKDRSDVNSEEGDLLRKIFRKCAF